jgi:hypothetical protein
MASKLAVTVVGVEPVVNVVPGLVELRKLPLLLVVQFLNLYPALGVAAM